MKLANNGRGDWELSFTSPHKRYRSSLDEYLVQTVNLTILATSIRRGKFQVPDISCFLFNNIFSLAKSLL